MARIYKRSDRIKVKIDDITISISPLSYIQKAEIQQTMMEGRTSGDVRKLTQGTALSIKYAVKDIQGVEDTEGKPYKLEFDADNNLTDTSIDDLFNLEITSKLTMVCASLARSIPDQFTDVDGSPLEGVEIVKTEPSLPNG